MAESASVACVDDAYLRRKERPARPFLFITRSLSRNTVLFYGNILSLALGEVSLGRARRVVMAPPGRARQRRKRLAVYALCGVVGLLGYGTTPNAVQSGGPDRVGRPDRVV